MFQLFSGRISLIYSIKKYHNNCSCIGHIHEEVFHMKKLATLFSSVYQPTQVQHPTSCYEAFMRPDNFYITGLT